MLQLIASTDRKVTDQGAAREFKSKEVTQAPIYVIVHSLLELSFYTQPFPTPKRLVVSVCVDIGYGIMALYKLCIIIIIFNPR